MAPSKSVVRLPVAVGKSVTTSSSGQVTMAYRYSKTRDYRFALYSTPISWDLGSAVTTR